MSGSQQFPPAPIAVQLTLSPNPNATPGSVPVNFTTADYDGSVPQLVAQAGAPYVTLTQFNPTPVQNSDGTYTFSGALISAALVSGESPPAVVYVEVEGQNNQEIDVTVVEGQFETGSVTLGPVNPPTVTLGGNVTNESTGTSSASLAAATAAAPAAPAALAALHVAAPAVKMAAPAAHPAAETTIKRT